MEELYSGGGLFVPKSPVLFLAMAPLRWQTVLGLGLGEGEGLDHYRPVLVQGGQGELESLLSQPLAGQQLPGPPYEDL